MRYRLFTIICMSILFGIFAYGKPVSAEGIIQVTGSCEEAGKAAFHIDIADEAAIDGIDIYRADTPDGEYQYVGNQETGSWGYGYYSYYYGYKYVDPSYLTAYRYYYYSFRPYKMAENEYIDEAGNYIYSEEKSYIENGAASVSVYVIGAGPDIKYGKRKGMTSAKIDWSRVDEADGYLIYCVSDMDKDGNMYYPNIYDENSYKLVKKIAGNNTCSATFKKLKHGVTYTYRIYCYKNVDGGQVKSFPSEIKSVPMDYYGYASESYDSKIKRAFGSEKKKNKKFSSAAKAGRQMKTIKIRVWDFQNGKSGKKVTKTKYLTVNKNLAPTIQKIFQEIYKSKEKQVIHDIGCYNYRTGQHKYGLAIDINSNENYMVQGKKILSGSFWKPGKNPYSIPEDCDFVKIMERYGFDRGLWGTRRDYMHFSYFGT